MGELRVHVIEVKDLKGANISLRAEGKSDPYAVVTVEDSTGWVHG